MCRKQRQLWFFPSGTYLRTPEADSNKKKPPVNYWWPWCINVIIPDRYDWQWLSLLYKKTPDMCNISFIHGEYPHASVRLVFPFSSMLAFFYYDVGTFVSSTRLSISTPYAAFFGVKIPSGEGIWLCEHLYCLPAWFRVPPGEFSISTWIRNYPIYLLADCPSAQGDSPYVNFLTNAQPVRQLSTDWIVIQITLVTHIPRIRLYLSHY